jgi:hypothetical protein
VFALLSSSFIISDSTILSVVHRTRSMSLTKSSPLKLAIDFDAMNIIAESKTDDDTPIRSYGSLDVQSPQFWYNCFGQTMHHSRTAATAEARKNWNVGPQCGSSAEDTGSVGWDNIFIQQADADDALTTTPMNTPEFWHNCFKLTNKHVATRRTSSKRRFSKTSQLPTISEDEERRM